MMCFRLFCCYCTGSETLHTVVLLPDVASVMAIVEGARLKGYDWDVPGAQTLTWSCQSQAPAHAMTFHVTAVCSFQQQYTR